MMDAKSKEMLDAILAKEPAALTDADKAFLKARRSYLNEEQRHVYAEALAQQPEAEQPKVRRGHKSSEESEA